MVSFRVTNFDHTIKSPQDLMLYIWCSFVVLIDKLLIMEVS